MSNRKNHRRDEERRTEHGPRWENKNPGAGCNATHVARSRKKHKDRARREERRTGKFKGHPMLQPRERPPIDEESEQ